MHTTAKCADKNHQTEFMKQLQSNIICSAMHDSCTRSWYWPCNSLKIAHDGSCICTTSSTSRSASSCVFGHSLSDLFIHQKGKCISRYAPGESWREPLEESSKAFCCVELHVRTGSSQSSSSCWCRSRALRTLPCIMQHLCSHAG